MYSAFKSKNKPKAKRLKCGQPTPSGPCCHSLSHENPCQSQGAYDKALKGVK